MNVAEAVKILVPILYSWRVEIGLGVLFVLFLILLGFVVNTYKMMKYLTAGRSWEGRFREIKRKLLRRRRG